MSIYRLNRAPLGPTDVSRYASVMQDHAHPGTSDRYSFIPTTRVLAVLADHGWTPTEVREGRTRLAETSGYQTHMVRLSNPAFPMGDGVGGARPEIILTNSHGGTSAFMLAAGILELVCTNGLIVGKDVESHKVRHVGYTDDAVSRAIESVATHLPRVLESRARMMALPLSPDESLAYARAAIGVRWEPAQAPEPRALLAPRRWGQSDPTLWNVFNTVQEHMIVGGARARRADGRRGTVRAIASVTENVKINRALWTLAEEMQRLKAA